MPDIPVIRPDWDELILGGFHDYRIDTTRLGSTTRTFTTGSSSTDATFAQPFRFAEYQYGAESAPVDNTHPAKKPKKRKRPVQLALNFA